jgi:hypothetical protein
MIKRVVVIRDNQYIHTQPGSGTEVGFTYHEESLTPGEHYYYVRAEQVDGNIAWASPIWVEFKP